MAHTINDLQQFQWKERDVNLQSVLEELESPAWTAAQSMPSEIHLELMAAKKIPDPFVGFNEHDIQWIGEREWLYKTQFTLDGTEISKDTYIELFFEGLDTFCDVHVNKTRLLSADNMFRRWRILLNVDDLAPVNTLLLHFKSAKLIAEGFEKDYGRVRAGSCNLGDPSRVYVRKAQYHWRWDWGPELMCCGPYRPIKLSTYRARIENFFARGIVAPSLSPTLRVDLDILGSQSAATRLTVVLKDRLGATIQTADVDIANPTSSSLKNVIDWELDQQVQLWWPVGYGEQHLYDVELELFGEAGDLLDRSTQRIGFRRVELIQETLAESDKYGTGTTFLFAVNNVRIFMGGSNWIPADSFLPSVKAERIRAWLQLMRDGNQNMVRLWGGGVYEPEIFYDTCDELGILVWQDFQFACGVYPAHDSFVASVKAEAEDNVKRLRHHPSLALLCGNNEDYQQVLQWGGIDDLPARKIYEEVLPDVVARLTDPVTPYHRGSPYGGKGWDTSDPTIGDVHQWDVWAGAQKPYQDYDLMGGRFVSEFGLPSMPDIRTVDYWMQGQPESQRYSQSKVMAQHNKAGQHEVRFAAVINDNFRLTSDLETYIYNTQMMQLDAVSWAYRAWKREWRGRGKEYCSGVLVWQLNDCWPVTSWAIVDYFLRPKPVYYAIARELRPITVGILREVTKNKVTDRPRQYYEFGAFQSRSASVQVWGTNSTLHPLDVQLILHCADLDSAWTHVESRAVSLSPNQTTELLDIPCPCPPRAGSSSDPDPPPKTTSHSVVVAVRIVDRATGAVLARTADWPQPYRYLAFPDPDLTISVSPGLERQGEGEGEPVLLHLEVEKPLKGLVLSAEGEGGEVKWSDNGVDLMPGDRQTVVVHGLGGRRVKTAYMGKERAS